MTTLRHTARAIARVAGLTPTLVSRDAIAAYLECDGHDPSLTDEAVTIACEELSSCYEIHGQFGTLCMLEDLLSVRRPQNLLDEYTALCESEMAAQS